MKTINELVQEYIFNVVILSKIENNEIESTLADVLEFNERYNINVFKLKKYIEDEYDVEFTDLCNCKGQEILNNLCEIEFNNKKQII